ncbi:hypothetical protein PR202_ga28512 [Eleusine coracana subsp. coracana]|uniref:F-box domain-containing protein n=1 Tax=Eleusine coracana subsp. coracana TaxID=191504 RepID=A0AAV5DJN3_ELECO|nr:hypothetical protein PR202_ga28512 [Eleusine coracana subsp. coracana]
MAPSLPVLLDELVEEIFLHLPPDEPAYLIHAALVCKPWLHILSNPGFRRRYIEFHQSPPVLGYIHNIYQSTGPIPRYPCDYANAAVLCAVDGCDHLDCHGGPFRVVFVGTEVGGGGVVNLAWVTVYSSEIGVWSSRTFVNIDTYYIKGKPSLLIGDDLYFTLEYCLNILKYDLNAHALSVIDSPCVVGTIVNIAEDGGLGFICVLDESIYTWSLSRASGESVAGWEKAQKLVMELGTMLPSHPSRLSEVVGLVEGTDTVFINSMVGVFTLSLKSRQVKKVGHGQQGYNAVLPYRSFYIPDRYEVIT